MYRLFQHLELPIEELLEFCVLILETDELVVCNGRNPLVSFLNLMYFSRRCLVFCPKNQRDMLFSFLEHRAIVGVRPRILLPSPGIGRIPLWSLHNALWLSRRSPLTLQALLHSCAVGPLAY